MIPTNDLCEMNIMSYVSRQLISLPFLGTVLHTGFSGEFSSPSLKFPNENENLRGVYESLAKNSQLWDHSPADDKEFC